MSPSPYLPYVSSNSSSASCVIRDAFGKIISTSRAFSKFSLIVIRIFEDSSGDSSPSDADVQITIVLREALNLIDVRVLDHIVVGANECVSMTECGLI